MALPASRPFGVIHINEYLTVLQYGQIQQIHFSSGPTSRHISWRIVTIPYGKNNNIRFQESTDTLDRSVALVRTHRVFRRGIVRLYYVSFSLLLFFLCTVYTCQYNLVVLLCKDIPNDAS